MYKEWKYEVFDNTTSEAISFTDRFELEEYLKGSILEYNLYAPEIFRCSGNLLDISNITKIEDALNITVGRCDPDDPDDCWYPDAEEWKISACRNRLKRYIAATEEAQKMAEIAFG